MDTTIRAIRRKVKNPELGSGRRYRLNLSEARASRSRPTSPPYHHPPTLNFITTTLDGSLAPGANPLASLQWPLPPKAGGSQFAYSLRIHWCSESLSES